MSSTKKYIKKRKRQAFFNRLCFYLCRMFTIKNNRVSVCSFEGRGGFGCNPKYIVEELHKRNEEYEIIWFVNDMNKTFPDYIKKVPNTLLSRAYWLSTSKVWIDNYRKPYGTVKRKGQKYINTWHATIAFKSIGFWRKEAFSEMAYLVSKNDSLMIDRVVIDSEWCAEVYPKGLLYSGEYLWSGAPRCDVLYGDRSYYKQKFCQKHGISEKSKIVMFAPTFRERAINGKREVFSEEWTIDFERLLFALKKRFSGEWYLCLRVHPQLVEKMEKYEHNVLKERVIDESQADDMYEILAAMDVFITDYSSAAMEAGYAHMPVFIYADDIKEYTIKRGGMLWNMMPDSKNVIKNNREITSGIDVELPYSVAQNNDELEKNIFDFNQENYEKKLRLFETAVGLIFDGQASKKVCDYIEQ